MPLYAICGVDNASEICAALIFTSNIYYGVNSRRMKLYNVLILSMHGVVNVFNKIVMFVIVTPIFATDLDRARFIFSAID